MPVAFAAVADFGLMAIALVAIVLLLALSVITYALDKALHYLPNVWPFNLLYNLGDFLVNAVNDSIDFLWGMVGALAHIFDLGTWFVVHIWDPLIHNMNEAWNAVWRTNNVVVPSAAAGAVSTSTAIINSTAATLQANTNNAVAQLQTQQSTGIAAVTATIGAASLDLTAQLAQQKQLLSDQITAAELLAVKQAADLVLPVDAAVRALEQDVPAIQSQVTDVVLPRVRDLEGAVQTVIPAAIAAAAAVGTAAATDFQTWKRTCGNNLCSNLGNMASILGDLGIVMDAELLLELIYEVANNPEGVKQELLAALDGPAYALAGAFGIARAA